MILPKLLASAKKLRLTEISGLRSAMIEGADGVPLRVAWRLPADMPADPPAGGPARGTMLFLPGRTEFIEKFYEDMRIAAAFGYAVAGFDLRGQGLSYRPGPDPGKHWIDSFDHHVSDVKRAVEYLSGQGMPKPFTIAAHSAGAHATLRVMSEHPGLIEVALLSSPMVAVNTPGLSLTAAHAIGRLVCALGLGDSYVPGHSAFRDGKWGWRKQLTHDDERFEDEDFFIREKDKGLAVGGATWQWLSAALASCRTLAGPGYPERIRDRVLVLRSGKDRIVDMHATDRLAVRIDTATLVPIEGAMHELFKETDDIRLKVWGHICDFLSLDPAVMDQKQAQE